MRFLSLVAHAFGPFHGRAVDFAPGMNVIYGRNEAGKSSLHAALYAGLCGMRRGPGKQAVDQEFEERHRPWEGAGWKVGVVVQLVDGRKVELVRDLDAKDKSTVTDLDLGRECGGEILGDGAPDGALWLGLDRRSFLATACVRQAELLAVLADPKALQEHLQRAADTSGTDSTAAAALENLDAFHREQVGQERKNSSKPLQAAVEAERTAEEKLEQARTEHEGYLRLLADEDRCKVAAEEIEHRLRLVGAARATREHRDGAARLARARELAARYPDGPPAGLAATEGLARRVTESLQAWRSRPDSVPLAGPSAADIGRDIATLPAPATGDLQPAPEVVEAEMAHAAARMSAADHSRGRPPEPVPPAAGGCSADELRALAATLESPEPRVDAVLEARLGTLDGRIQALAARDRLQGVLIAAGIAAGAAGLVLVARARLLPGVGLVVLGAGLALWGLMKRGRHALVAAHAESRQIESQVAQARLRRDEWLRAQEEARARSARLGQAADAGSLQALAAALDAAVQAARECERWRLEAESRARAVDERATELRRLLTGRGVVPTLDLAADAAGYRQACAARARRQALEEKLAARRKDEEGAARSVAQRQDAAAALGRAAADCGVAGDGEEVVAAGLSDWLDARKEALAGHDRALREWNEFESLLGGKPLQELQAEVEARGEKARLAAREFAPQEIAALVADPATVDSEMALLVARSRQAESELADVRVTMREREGRLASVAETEEALAAAQSDLERVRRLDATLKLTRSFLVKAQEHVHRSIAPVLAAALRDWLPAVTHGRYTEALVDPETLEVKVRAESAPWRRAPRLSHGTAEQVYLGLRIAMAKHLTGRGEVCPLLLDDVTVQSDPERKIAILEALRAASADRQVIFFTQEDEVLAWAEAHLVPPRDAVRRLDGAGVAP